MQSLVKLINIHFFYFLSDFIIITFVAVVDGRFGLRLRLGFWLWFWLGLVWNKILKPVVVVLIIVGLIVIIS